VPRTKLNVRMKNATIRHMVLWRSKVVTMMRGVLAVASGSYAFPLACTLPDRGLA